MSDVEIVVLDAEQLKDRFFDMGEAVQIMRRRGEDIIHVSFWDVPHLAMATQLDFVFADIASAAALDVPTRSNCALSFEPRGNQLKREGYKPTEEDTRHTVELIEAMLQVLGMSGVQRLG